MAYAPPKKSNKNTWTFRKNFFLDDFCPSRLYQKYEENPQLWKKLRSILKWPIQIQKIELQTNFWIIFWLPGS